jgi:hypothetical protein
VCTKASSQKKMWTPIAYNQSICCVVVVCLLLLLLRWSVCFPVFCFGCGFEVL